MQFDFDRYFANRPVIIAPMEDVTDPIFRKLCRARGADLMVTEFINVEGLLRGCKNAKRKMRLAPDDRPTAIQIYGSDATRLAEAAEVATAAEPAFLDINCGCWVPKIARRGAGAGWLRDPDEMVRMAKMVVRATSLPVTVKTRIGWGPESDMPIVELARRLQDVGVRAIAIHCRTAKMGHSGDAEWEWARKAQRAVDIPVILNGDVRSAHDALRAFETTGVAGVMIGRGAIAKPWIVGQCRALIDHGTAPSPVGWRERLQLCRDQLDMNAAHRGEARAVRGMRRYYPGYLKGLPSASTLRHRLNRAGSRAEVFALYDEYADYLRQRERDGMPVDPAVAA